jgi:membrane protease subunit HflK
VQGPSVALIGAEVFVHYRISDVLAYATASADPVQEFELLAEREISRYFLRMDIDETISGARNRIGRDLEQYLRNLIAQQNLGLEVVWVGLSALHPAQPVVDAFYETVGAEQERETAIQRAMQDEIRILAEAAGTREGAERILEEISRLESMKSGQASQEEMLQQEALLEELIQQAGGKASELLADARAYRWTVENLEHGRALRFASELEAYQTVPDFYKNRRYLETLGDGMQEARKWIISADRKDMVLKGDLKDTLSALDALNLGR